MQLNEPEQQSMIQLKRERFRFQIRREYLHQQLTKKRTLIPNQEAGELNEKLLKVRNQMIAITENIYDFPKAMNNYYDHLVDMDLMNEILLDFQLNYHPNGRINIYWILSNLTLGNGIGSKFLFDTTFKFLDILYYDMSNLDYSNYGIEIIQNLLADRDIDVFEFMMEDDQLLNVLNNNRKIIPEERYQQILVHICTRIVHFKSYLSNYTVETICSLMPNYFSFQSTFILAKGLETQNHHLILHAIRYLLENNVELNFILLKILEQINEELLLQKIFSQKDINQSIISLFLTSQNSDIVNIILTIYQNVSMIDDLQQVICQKEVLNKAINISLELQFTMNALKFLDTWMIDVEFLHDFPTLISEEFFFKQIMNLSVEYPGEALAILQYLRLILVFGDFTNDDSYSNIMHKCQNQFDPLIYSENDCLASRANDLLLCYQ